MLFLSIVSNVSSQFMLNESGLYKRDELHFRECTCICSQFTIFKLRVVSFVLFLVFPSCVPLYPAIFVSLCYCKDLGKFYVFGGGSFHKFFKMSVITSWNYRFPLSLLWWNVDSLSFWWAEKNSQGEFSLKALPCTPYLEVTSLCTPDVILFLLISSSSLPFPTSPYCHIHLSALAM